MTREEIILMAEESTPDQMIGGFEFDYEQLLHFASLVAAAEREACAKFIEDLDPSDHLAATIAAVIRARGQG